MAASPFAYILIDPNFDSVVIRVPEERTRPQKKGVYIYPDLILKLSNISGSNFTVSLTTS